MREPFVTTSLWVASYCVLQGAELLAVIPKDNDAMFLFDSKARDAAKVYWTGEPTVNLHDLVNTRSRLVRRIRQARH